MIMSLLEHEFINSTKSKVAAGIGLMPLAERTQQLGNSVLNFNQLSRRTTVTLFPYIAHRPRVGLERREAFSATLYVLHKGRFLVNIRYVGIAA